MHPPLIYRLVALIQVQADLMCLDFCRPAHPLHLKPPELSTVATPLKVQALQKALSGHPDQARVRTYAMIGFQRGSPLKPAQNNLESASVHPEAVDEFIKKELLLGCLFGPVLDMSDLPPLQVNRISVVPKGESGG